MKKLSKMEIDVVVNKVVNEINEVKENKGKRIFEISEFKGEFLDKLDEILKIEKELDKLIKEIREIENKFNKDGIKVYFYDNNNYGRKGIYNISLLNDKSVYYGEVFNEMVLNNIDEEINIKEYINKLVEKFK
jgi:vacuolar-type H+-ATPase subunit I/STV1